MNDCVDRTIRPLVSVVCLTYNQADYIEECLISLISQKTTFSYEIIVHDDCSLDGTREIVERYVRQYPNLIVPIFEEENQYSKGVSIQSIIAPFISGKYVAICEGDDYWIDENKLQIQCSYLEQNRECSLAVHQSYGFDSGKQKVVKTITDCSVERHYMFDEVVLGGGGLFSTNSMCFPSEYYLLPESFRNWGVGDIPRLLFLASKGYIWYSDKAMSVYRLAAEGSWTLRVNSSIDSLNSMRKKIISGYEKLLALDEFKDNNAIIRMVRFNKIKLYAVEGKWFEIANSDVKEEFDLRPLKWRMAIYLIAHFPVLFRCYLKIRYRQ